MQPLDRLHFDAARLMAEHPPRFHHRNKQAVFNTILAAGQAFNCQITYARWPEVPLPRTVMVHSRFQTCSGYFTYTPTRVPGLVEWHMNFADPQLFFAYGSPLMAQDELQVAEHPLLAALREALVAMGKPAITIDAGGRPTPVTVSGVQRHCVVQGLYGNAFASTSVEQVVAATHPLVPPTVSNILAMAAPACGSGAYNREQVASIVRTATTGFLAARWESEAITNKSTRTAIHTGFWGCGAFGGNRTLMTILQALAADLAEVDIIFHSGDEAGLALANDAYDRYVRLQGKSASLSNMLGTLVRQGFIWGESDGN